MKSTEPKKIILKSMPKGIGKLIKIGNARGVVLPKTALEYSGWKTGDYLTVDYNDEQKTFIITNLTYASKAQSEEVPA